MKRPKKPLETRGWAGDPRVDEDVAGKKKFSVPAENGTTILPTPAHIIGTVMTEIFRLPIIDVFGTIHSVSISAVYCSPFNDST
jgi:hypothetical protein